MAVEAAVAGSAGISIIGGSVVGVVPNSWHDVLVALGAVVYGGGDVGLGHWWEGLLNEVGLVLLLSQNLLNFSDLFSRNVGGLRTDTLGLKSGA